MAAQNATVRVIMDIPTLRRFALYDVFIFRHGWRLPTIFSGIMLIFGLIAFFSGKSQAYLLGSVLMLIALGMPAAYYFTFIGQVKARGKALGLEKRKAAYTVALTPDGVTIENNMKQEDLVHLEWDKLHAACRGREAIYLYAAPQKAFILPDGQADLPAQELWKLLEGYMGKKKMCGSI